MRFCDLFISYKIGLKDIKSTIPFTKLPLYRKIAVVAIFSIIIIIALLQIIKLHVPSLITLGVFILFIVVFTIIDSREKNLELMLKKHYIPYSQKRMNMVINVLHKYNIDVHDTNTIEALIDEAQKAQVQSNYLLPLKKPLKTLNAIIIIPIVTYVAQKIGDNTTQAEIIPISTYAIAIALMTFSLIFALSTIVKEIFYCDYNKYNELISDLRQIKLFYSKETSPSSN